MKLFLLFTSIEKCDIKASQCWHLYVGGCEPKGREESNRVIVVGYYAFQPPFPRPMGTARHPEPPIAPISTNTHFVTPFGTIANKPITAPVMILLGLSPADGKVDGSETHENMPFPRPEAWVFSGLFGG
ncbi:ferric-rhodotorulic acid outer membrane transporter [Anopheles sinensis]|uniref:Ferric-rhodotorulic acid outer membrane transporter n=1 Tax=Anopheles sinensis TaxID=74873 RepID=A0A084WMZ1_ANOSI|nr:ferric-rhodotorulic acid outer membrane transporter [Anopheles sinensis]